MTTTHAGTPASQEGGGWTGRSVRMELVEEMRAWWIRVKGVKIEVFRVGAGAEKR